MTAGEKFKRCYIAYGCGGDEVCAALCPVDRAPIRRNLDDALALVEEIDRVRAVQRELRAAFARSELDGGAKAAPAHPLYIEAEARLAQLHEQLMLLI